MIEEQNNASKTEKQNTDETLEVSSEDTAEAAPAKRTTEEVRQGHTGDHVRYILIISFLGALAALFVLYSLQRSQNASENGAGQEESAQIRIETARP